MLQEDVGRNHGRISLADVDWPSGKGSRGLAAHRTRPLHRSPWRSRQNLHWSEGMLTVAATATACRNLKQEESQKITLLQAGTTELEATGDATAQRVLSCVWFCLRGNIGRRFCFARYGHFQALQPRELLPRTVVIRRRGIDDIHVRYSPRLTKKCCSDAESSLSLDSARSKVFLEKRRVFWLAIYYLRLPYRRHNARTRRFSHSSGGRTGEEIGDLLQVFA